MKRFRKIIGTSEVEAVAMIIFLKGESSPGSENIHYCKIWVGWNVLLLINKEQFQDFPPMFYACFSIKGKEKERNHTSGRFSVNYRKRNLR